MSVLFKEDKYSFLSVLANDVLGQTVSEQFLSLSFTSEPLKFYDAPLGVPLLVMSDFLNQCELPSTLHKHTSLLKGSIVIKLPHQSNPHYPCECGDGKGLLYSDVAFSVSYMNAGHYSVLEEHNQLTVYDLENTVGYVVPVSDVLSNGLHLFYTEHINTNMFNEQQINLEPVFA